MFCQNLVFGASAYRLEVGTGRHLGSVLAEDGYVLNIQPENFPLRFAEGNFRHAHTMEGFWSLLRSWLRPHRGISHLRTIYLCI